MRNGLARIEVVVITMIVILVVAILACAFKRTRQDPRAITCAMNLRTHLMALATYAEQSGDWMPRGPSMADPLNVWPTLYRYEANASPSRFSNLEKCPFLRRMRHKESDPVYSLDSYLCQQDVYYHTCVVHNSPRFQQQREDTWVLSYCANYEVFGASRADGNGRRRYEARKLGSIKKPSGIVCFSEQGSRANIGAGTWELVDRNDQNNQCGFQIRHSNGGNMVYVDGHVQLHKLNYSDPQFGLPPFPQAWWPDYESSPGAAELLARYVRPRPLMSDESSAKPATRPAKEKQSRDRFNHVGKSTSGEGDQTIGPGRNVSPAEP